MRENVTIEELSFEDAFERLQATVQKLEEGGLTLEECIAQFELGTRLANLCTNMLDRAELRVNRLMAGQVEEPTIEESTIIETTTIVISGE